MPESDSPADFSASVAEIAVAKKRLRAQGRAIRAALGTTERAAASAKICAQLRQFYEAAPAESVAVYLATPDEVNLDDFIAWLLARGVPVFAPRGDGFAPLESLDAVQVERFGLREPCPHPRPLSQSASRERGVLSQIWQKKAKRNQVADSHLPSPAKRIGRGAGGEGALILVPGLLFDRRGGRLGFGGGWYDRALARFPQAVKIGVAFAQQIVDEVPREAHDVLMSVIVSSDEKFKIQNSKFKIL